MTRADGRSPAQLRPVTIEPGFIENAHGSVLFSIGKTRLVCTAMIEETVPGWMRGRGSGWVTSEYGMLPGSTSERKPRDAARGRQDGRTVEIQRLIGRSLRSVVDFKALGERTVWIDCDVLQADGGTRCAAICGGYVALVLALPGWWSQAAEGAAADATRWRPSRSASWTACRCSTCPTSEDSRAEVDMNVVISGRGQMIEVQATAEKTPFGRASLDDLLVLAADGIEQISAIQTRVLHDARTAAVG